MARGALIVCSPLLVAAAAELVLRLFGFGDPTSFFLKRASGTEYITNEKFAFQFAGRSTALKPFLSAVPLHKAPGVIRVCILGESAAMGTPDPAFGFGRILEAQLRDMYPGQKFEFVNAAMRGINSYAVRMIAAECAGHEMDLFIVYMGNNEVVGLHGPTPETPGWKLSLPFIHTVEFIKRTRVGQLLDSVVAPDDPEHNQDMDFFRSCRMRQDDPRIAKVQANFKANLHDICRTITGSGAKLLLCTVAGNLRDCPPLGSLHRNGLSPEQTTTWEKAYQDGIVLQAQNQNPEALARYLEAAQIDDHYAELHFRMAQCYSAMHQTQEAREQYIQARDWDALQFRTSTALNNIIRAEAQSLPPDRVTLVDVEKAFFQSPLCEEGVPGGRLFYEHVHPTFPGNFLLAATCSEPLAKAAGIHTPPAVTCPTPQECADLVGYTLYEDINVQAAMVRLTARPPFLDQLNHDERQAAAEAQNKQRLAAFGPQDADRCIATHRKVIARDGDFWPSRYNLGSLCFELKLYNEAARQLKAVSDMYPEKASFHAELGMALLRSGDKTGADVAFHQAKRLQPRDKEIRQLLEQTGVR